MTEQGIKVRASVVAGLLTMTTVMTTASPVFADAKFPHGKIVVANRNSQSISVIDVKTDTVVGTHPLPDSGEPMYVVYSPERRRVFVGDRANDRVVVFNSEHFGIETTIPAGDGIWHMWADPSLPQSCAPEHQLWVNNDVDKTITVIDTVSLEVITTIPVPDDLVDAGGKPHDVILDPVSRFAYITVIGLPGPDIVVQYSTRTFVEVDRIEVGEDPHLSLAAQNHFLYVPCQNTHNVFVLDRDSLAPIVPPLDVTGAHGAGLAPNGKTFYTTNFPGSGVAGLVAIE